MSKKLNLSITSFAIVFTLFTVSYVASADTSSLPGLSTTLSSPALGSPPLSVRSVCGFSPQPWYFYHGQCCSPRCFGGSNRDCDFYRKRPWFCDLAKS